MEIIGFALAIIVGISLGLIGSGGSILTVPILVYIMGIDPITATAYSLFIVGVTSLFGGFQSAIHKQVDFRTVVIFGIPSIVAVYVTRAFLMPMIPHALFSIGSFEFTKPIALMILFSVVMILAALPMIRPNERCDEPIEQASMKYNYPIILVEGISVGVLTGLVGAGGGFLIIPALVLLAKMPMRLAVGTSLFIIAAKSIIGFTGDLSGKLVVDWTLLFLFTSLSVLGICIGILIARKVPSTKLKTSFGWFVLVMGVYIIIKELFVGNVSH